MALDGALDGGIVLAIQNGGGGPPAAHATTHQNGGSDQLTVYADTVANRIWASPASGGAAGPAFRALALLDIPAYARTFQVECQLSGVLPGLAATYAAPGTTTGGVGAATPLYFFWVPGVVPASTWTLQGSLGTLGTAPGGLNTLTATVQKSTGGGAFSNTANTFTITGVATSNTDDSHAITFSSGDAVAVRVDGGGASADLHLSLVFVRTS